jgi:hypothetical protein
MERNMNKILIILIALIMVPSIVSAEEDATEQNTLAELLTQYEVQQKVSSENVDPNSELRKLRNQMIDLRVERDALADENNYLKNQLENHHSEDAQSASECLNSGECVYVGDIENERIISYVIYSLSLYRMAELVTLNTPLENVEAHEKAQKIMAGVKADLDVLGYDTTNMQEYPELDELLQQFKIASGSRLTR